MEYLLKIFAQHWHLSSAQYWHLRLLSAILVGPFIGVLYLVFFGGLAPRKPRATTSPKPPMRISSTGKLLY